VAKAATYGLGGTLAGCLFKNIHADCQTDTNIMIGMISPDGGDDPLLNDGGDSPLLGQGAERSGSLSIEGSSDDFSASEKAVAQELVSQGKNVILREPSGVDRTSDLLVDGTPYDVYTPNDGTSVRNILSNVASKWTQVNGGGVVVDLSNTNLSASDFGDNPLARVNGFINSYGGTPMSDLLFYGGS
jgi:hypothetical protein